MRTSAKELIFVERKNPVTNCVSGCDCEISCAEIDCALECASPDFVEIKDENDCIVKLCLSRSTTSITHPISPALCGRAMWQQMWKFSLHRNTVRGGLRN